MVNVNKAINMKENEKMENETGINSKYEGIPIILEENGDLIFRCGSIDKARALARDILNKLCSEDMNENRKTSSIR